ERQNLMSAEKNQQALQGALESVGDDTVRTIHHAERVLSNVGHPALENLSNRVAELATLAADVAAELEQTASRLLPDPERLVEVDERLFALKDCARKHKCTADELAEVYTRLQTEYDNLNNAEESLEALEKKAAVLREAFAEAAAKLTE